MVLFDTGTPGTSREIYDEDADDRTQLATPRLGKELSLSSCCIASLHIFNSQLWLTSHPRGTVVLLDTETPGTSTEIYGEGTDGCRTCNPLVINRVL